MSKSSKVKSTKTENCTFTLKHVNIKALFDKFYFQTDEPSKGENIDHSQLRGGGESVVKRHFTITEPNGSKQKLWVPMIDIAENLALPLRTNLPCDWCRHTFTSKPIGIPIRYVDDVKREKDTERVTEILKKNNYNTDTTDFFETKGIFCSFSCAKAFLLENKNKIIYKESCTLLTLLCFRLTGKVCIIPKAGSWELIYPRGSLTIDEFRDSFGRIEYNELCTPKRPYMFCTTEYIQEKKLTI